MSGQCLGLELLPVPGEPGLALKGPASHGSHVDVTLAVPHLLLIERVTSNPSRSKSTSICSITAVRIIAQQHVESSTKRRFLFDFLPISAGHRFDRHFATHHRSSRAHNQDSSWLQNARVSPCKLAPSERVDIVILLVQLGIHLEFNPYTAIAPRAIKIP
ncbi:hypothetical protein VTO42DRAFT_5343 [Malbranchea cinnamomea]